MPRLRDACSSPVIAAFTAARDMALLRHRIDKAERLGAPAARGAAGQHHGHGLDRIDQRGQPNGAAETGVQAEQHFGKAEARVVDGDAVVAGERDFEAAAEAIAVDDRDGRQRQRSSRSSTAWACASTASIFARVGDALELVDVGAGDEAGCVWPSGSQGRAAGRARCSVSACVELGQHLGVERVGAGALLVEQQPGDAVGVGRIRQCCHRAGVLRAP